MSTPFSRTLRALETDSSRFPLVLILTAAGLAACGAVWLVYGRVTVYEVTADARLEVDRAAHSVEAPVAGRIVTNRMVVGRDVAAGDVLVSLDARLERLKLDEEKARLDAAAAQLLALQQEIAELAAGESHGARAAVAGRAEAQAHLREAEEAARLSEEEANRLGRLAAEGQVSEAEAKRAAAEAKQKRAAADALAMGGEKLSFERASDDSDRRARRADLETEAARLEGERARATAAVAVLALEVERRLIRASVAGRIGEVGSIPEGAYVREGDRLGSVVPRGQLRVVADFDPPSALGRIRAGQPARVRLKGFPWTQYGSLAATVARVSSELRDGKVRVDLDVVPAARSRIPLEHGLPGSVEVEVERVRPVVLLLRAAGQRLAEPVATASGKNGG